MWHIDYHLIEDWLDAQDAETVACVFAALEILEREGPALGRPLVDSVQGSKVKNLKELRPASPKGACIRILFAFDPQRSAVMLVAGDKSVGKQRWTNWYKEAVSLAEKLYGEHVWKQGGANG